MGGLKETFKQTQSVERKSLSGTFHPCNHLQGFVNWSPFSVACDGSPIVCMCTCTRTECVRNIKGMEHSHTMKASVAKVVHHRHVDQVADCWF